jgi:hypothetical protein
LKRFLSSPFFLIALIAFFLPFFAVTCAGGGGDLLGGLPGGSAAQEATEVTGLELVTGQAEENLEDTGQTPQVPGLPSVGPSADPTGGVPFGPEGGSEPVDLATAQIWAIAAAAVALLGIFLALLAGRAGGAMALIFGVAGGALLFLLASEFKNAIVGAIGAEAEAFITVENRIGYWIALGGFIVAAITGLVRLLLPDRPAYVAPAAAGFGGPPAGPVGPPPSGPPPAGPPPAGPPPAGPPPAAPPGP